MKISGYFTIVFILSLLIMLLFFPSICLAGARTGLTLWFETVIPVLFPFFIVTKIMGQFHVNDCINLILSPVVRKIFRVSPASTFPILLGFISGFPLGAGECAVQVREKNISQKEGQYILSFCNNVSPAFLTGYVSLKALERESFLPLLLVYSSALLTSLTLRYHYRTDKSMVKSHKNTKKHEIYSKTMSFSYFMKVFDEALVSSAEILVKIGGYIIMFSVLQKIILLPVLKYPGLPSGLCLFLVMLSGGLEVTSGISIVNEYLTAHPLSFLSLNFDTVKTALILMLTSFGGFCAMAQTKSVITGSGLSIKKYFSARILNAFYVFIITIIICTIIGRL